MTDTNHPTPWKSRVRPPEDGEAVSGGIAGRGQRDNEQRTRHLKEVLDGIEAGRILVLRDQPFEAGMLQWMAVYMDDDGVWRPALAELEGGGLTSSQVTLSSRSYAQGLVLYKDQDTIGGVLLSGSTTAGPELLDVLDGSFVAGLYYLSQTSEGKLTVSRPAAAVRLCTLQGPNADGHYRIFLQPALQGELSDHLHYHVPLVCQPAGTPNCVPPWEGPYMGDLTPEGPYPGTVHTVMEPDVNVAGWLPADHSSFDGMVKPDGALFGYNIPQDARLASVWPPVPAGYGYVEVDTGFGSVGVSGALVIINEYGIWWMNNTYGNAPWSPDYSPCSGTPPESSDSSNEYRTPFTIRIDFWFTRITFGAQLYVTSLRAADASVLVTDLADLPAEVGGLQVRLNDLVEVEDFGTTVVKNILGSTGQILRGPTVGGLRTLTSSVRLQGGEIGADGYRRGNIDISYADPNASRELAVSPIALNNAEEETYDGVMLLNLPAGRASEIRGKLAVDSTELAEGTSLALTLCFWLLARQTVTLSSPSVGLLASYRKVSAPDGCTPSALPGATAEVALGFSQLCANELSAGEYVEVRLNAVTVTPGDLIYFSFGKTGSAYDVGLLKIAPRLEVVEG